MAAPGPSQQALPFDEFAIEKIAVGEGFMCAGREFDACF
jgi:hypothetical protein